MPQTRREFLRAFASMAAAPAAMAALPVAAARPRLIPSTEAAEAAFLANLDLYLGPENAPSLVRWYTGPLGPADYFEFFGLPRPTPTPFGA